ncbi:MAG: YebC/PmpR family DNA-binding transcriptional regulator [Ignavibacteria bacterium]|nr:YebC/PmpR family DNA-binding transcriptional regulator [Ignavibacteria bacterium]
MAGHSKWANIKHRKSTVDFRRGKMFTKLSKEIIVASRIGGPDPDSNARLRLAIRTARSLSMPSDNIKRAIERGSGGVEGQQFEDVMYEGYGPGGVALIVIGATDNRIRTIKDVRAAFAKYGGNLGETNSVAWNFSHKGELVIESDVSEDYLLEMSMDSGADNLKIIESGAVVHCSFDNLGSCENFFASKEISVKESRFIYEPNVYVQITDSEHARVLVKLLDVLEDNDDVQVVFNNADIDDDVLDSL